MLLKNSYAMTLENGAALEMFIWATQKRSKNILGIGILYLKKAFLCLGNNILKASVYE